MIKVNLGCGDKVLKGWINIDKYYPAKGVIKADITKKLPFKDNSVDLFLLDNVLEHLDDSNDMIGMCHKKLKKGGKLKIIVPHYLSINCWGDPTHKKGFSARSFLYFKKNHTRNYYFNFSYNKLKIRLRFAKNILLFWNYVIEPIANLLKYKSIFLWELFPILSAIFPPSTIEVELIK